MKLSIAKAAAILLISVASGTVQAGAAPFQKVQRMGIEPTAPSLQMTLLLPAVQAFANPQGPVADTCTSSTPGNPAACDIDDLTQRCDDAGGGMSSLPGGGVDCDTSGWD